jgi:hypothetical protein
MLSVENLDRSLAAKMRMKRVLCDGKRESFVNRGGAYIYFTALRLLFFINMDVLDGMQTLSMATENSAVILLASTNLNFVTQLTLELTIQSLTKASSLMEMVQIMVGRMLTLFLKKC